MGRVGNKEQAISNAMAIDVILTDGGMKFINKHIAEISRYFQAVQ